MDTQTLAAALSWLMDEVNAAVAVDPDGDLQRALMNAADVLDQWRDRGTK